MKNLCLSFTYFLLCCLAPLCGAESCFVEVPVWFPMIVKLPIVHVEIQGVKLKMVLDLGAGCDLMIRKEVLEKIEKKRESGEIRFYDIKGTVHASRMYQLPSIQILDLEISDVIALEENVDFLTEGSVFKKNIRGAKDMSTCADGRIGLGILSRYNLLFDFPKSLSFEVGGEVRFGEGVTEVPFEVNEFGVMLTIETDVGVKQFLLDTGANFSFLQASLIEEGLAKEWIGGLNRYKCRKFILGDRDFGAKQLCLIDLPEKFEDDLDGILGVDFFRKHKIYLDFRNFRAFIE